MTRLVDKYRPKTLADIRGQDDVMWQLTEWLKSPAPGVFLFAGGTGTGKTSAAIVLAHELGVAVEEREFGGLHEIASGEQTGVSVRDAVKALHCSPFMGSGWRVLIVNECDHMTTGAAMTWLDALEHLPPRSVVIFTTNLLSKIPQRLRDRCEVFRFESSALLMRNDLQRFAAEVWENETGRRDCSDIEDFGPVADDNGEGSYRRLLQQMEPAVRMAHGGVGQLRLRHATKRRAAQLTMVSS